MLFHSRKATRSALCKHDVHEFFGARSVFQHSCIHDQLFHCSGHTFCTTIKNIAEQGSISYGAFIGLFAIACQVNPMIEVRAHGHRVSIIYFIKKTTKAIIRYKGANLRKQGRLHIRFHGIKFFFVHKCQIVFCSL